MLPKLTKDDTSKNEMKWWLYILRCRDGSFYTGIAIDPKERLKQHNSGKGARYTRGRGPSRIVYREECGNRSKALKRECAVKKLSRDEKKKLIRKKT